MVPDAPIFLGLTLLTSHAWNRTGHRAIALIAYRESDLRRGRRLPGDLAEDSIAYDRWEERKINTCSTSPPTRS